MKKMSLLNATTLFLVVMLLSASVFQCRKEGDLVKGLNRSFIGTSDSTLYAAFYESNPISTADATPDVNDVMKFRGVQTIVHEYCATSNCHNGPIAPKLDSYADIMKYVTAGNPEGSKLWEFLTTNDLDKAMPPVNSNHEMNATDKALLYNWIRNGAKERPDLSDYRPAAIALINTGCGSANCHNQATATGAWARKGLIAGLTAADTTMYTYINPQTGAKTLYCLLTNESLRKQVWNAYKDSVNRFYGGTSLSDTALASNAPYRPWKTLTSPRSASSTRGPLQDYSDIILSARFPKSVRSNSAVAYTDPTTLVQYYAKGNPLNAGSSLISRIDSTLLLANPFTGVFATSHQGDMAYGDGGLKGNEIALVKAWYFADPNIPDVWKYGTANAGIFKYRKTGNVIKK